MHPHHRTPHASHQGHATGVSLPGVLMPPIGVIEGLQSAREGKVQLPGGLGTLVPPFRPPSDRDKPASDDKFPWATFAWVSLGIVGAGVLVYAVSKGRTS